MSVVDEDTRWFRRMRVTVLVYLYGGMFTTVQPLMFSGGRGTQ